MKLAQAISRRKLALLWLLMLTLLATVLGTLVWLAERYESSQVQSQLERDAANVVNDIRSGLTLNVQSLQALHSRDPSPADWSVGAAELLRDHRELLRLEWRNTAIAAVAVVDSPYRPPVFEVLGRMASQADVSLACATAQRFNSAAYSANYFVPQRDSLGIEVIELCIPLMFGGQARGYVVATYSLAEVLNSLVGRQLTRSQEVSFAEADGARLALRGVARRGTPVFTARQLLDLPGNTMVVRLDS